MSLMPQVKREFEFEVVGPPLHFPMCSRRIRPSRATSSSTRPLKEVKIAGLAMLCHHVEGRWTKSARVFWAVPPKQSSRIWIEGHSHRSESGMGHHSCNPTAVAGSNRCRLRRNWELCDCGWLRVARSNSRAKHGSSCRIDSGHAKAVKK